MASLSLARLVDLVTMQHGVLTRTQLREHGYSDGQIDRLVARGDLIRVARGVLRVVIVAESWEQSVMVATLCIGSDAVVSHRTAAALHGLDGFERQGAAEVTVGRARREVAPRVRVHSSRQLARPDIVVVDGFKATSAARTIIDLASAGLSGAQLGNAIDSAARLGLASPEYILRRLAALDAGHRKGSAMLRELMLDAGGHSFLERRFLGLVRAAGLPKPQCQVIHRSGRSTIARVDFEWPVDRLVVEVNGRRGHVSEMDRSKDSRRRNALQAQGFVVFEFTTSQVCDDPQYVVAAVLGHLTGGEA